MQPHWNSLFWKLREVLWQSQAPIYTNTHTDLFSTQLTAFSITCHVDRHCVLFLRAVRTARPLQHCEKPDWGTAYVSVHQSMCLYVLRGMSLCLYIEQYYFFFLKTSTSVHLSAFFCVCVHIIKGVSEVTDFRYKGPRPKVFLSTSSLCKGHVWRALCCITMDRREGEQGRGRERDYKKLYWLAEKSST